MIAIDPPISEEKGKGMVGRGEVVVRVHGQLSKTRRTTCVYVRILEAIVVLGQGIVGA